MGEAFFFSSRVHRTRRATRMRSCPREPYVSSHCVPEEQLLIWSSKWGPFDVDLITRAHRWSQSMLRRSSDAWVRSI